MTPTYHKVYPTIDCVGPKVLILNLPPAGTNEYDSMLKEFDRMIAEALMVPKEYLEARPLSTREKIRFYCATH
jgi:hypothetical protein